MVIHFRFVYITDLVGKLTETKKFNDLSGGVGSLFKNICLQSSRDSKIVTTNICDLFLFGGLR